MNKKAMMEFLVGLVILLVVALFVIILYGKTQALSEAQNTVDVCKNSIEINAIGHISGMELFDEVKCPTEYKTIDTDNNEEIKKTLAHDMASCWYKMGQGQYELFPANILQKTQFCVICTVDEFDSNQKVEGFLDYMAKNPAPLIYTGGKAKSYTDYLQRYSTDDIMKLQYEQETDDIIDTSYDYATIFMYTKKGYVSKELGAVGGAAAGLTVGLVGGALIIGGWTAPAGIAILGTVAGAGGGYALGSEKSADWDSGVLLVPYTTESLEKLGCEILPAKQQNT